MTHDMTLRSNPRLLLFYCILAALPLGAIMLYPRLPQFMGAGLLALSFFIDYKLFRFAQPYLKTKVVTDESAVTIFLAGQEESFSWTEITLCGKCVPQVKGGRPFVFVYHLGKDRIITIPYEYSDMRGLESTLAEKAPYEVFPLSSGMDIRQILHDRYHADKDAPS
jgi:hypothetical protein